MGLVDQAKSARQRNKKSSVDNVQFEVAVV